MFNDIIRLLSEQIEAQKRKLAVYEKSYKDAKTAKELKDNKKNISPEQISKYYPSVSLGQSLTKLFSSATACLNKGDFKSIDIGLLKDSLEKAQIAPEILEKLEACYKFSETKRDDLIDGIYLQWTKDVIAAMQMLNTNIILSIPALIENSYNQDYKADYERGPERIERTKAKIKELEGLLAFFKDDEKKGYFESKEEFEKVYSGWIKDNVEISKQIELLHELNKLNLKRRIQVKDEEIEQDIEQNNEEVLKELEKQTKPKEYKTIDDIDPEEYEGTEKEIIIEFKNIYNDLASKTRERTKNLLELDSPIEDRELYYTNGDTNYELGIILGDIEENVIPNIKKEKEKVLNIIKLITKIYGQDKNQEDVRTIIIEKYEHIIKNLSNHNNVHSRMPQSIKNGSMDYVLTPGQEKIINGYHIEDIELSKFLRETVEPFKQLLSEYQKVVIDSKAERKVTSDGSLDKEINELLEFIIEAEGIESAKHFIEELSQIYPEANEFVPERKEDKKPLFEELEEKAEKYYEAHGDEYVKKVAGRKEYPYQEQLLIVPFDLPERATDDPKACLEVVQTITAFKDFREIEDYDDLTIRPSNADFKKNKIPKVVESYENVPRIFSYVTGKDRSGNSGRAIIVQLDPSEQVKEGLREAYKTGNPVRLYMLVDSLSISHGNHDAYQDVIIRLSSGEVHDAIQEIANKVHDPNPTMSDIIRLIDSGLDRKQIVQKELDTKVTDEKCIDDSGNSMQGNEGGAQR